MEQDRHSQVRDRAHAIWLEEGMPEGQAEQHWNRAESEIDAGQGSTTGAPTPAASTDNSVSEAAPSAGEAPEFQNPEPAPVAPDVAAITGQASANEPAAAPAAAKKPTRRKTKPVSATR